MTDFLRVQLTDGSLSLVPQGNWPVRDAYKTLNRVAYGFHESAHYAVLSSVDHDFTKQVSGCGIDHFERIYRYKTIFFEFYSGPKFVTDTFPHWSFDLDQIRLRHLVAGM